MTMNVTWAALTLIAGLAMLGFGALATFAAGMSDAPEEGTPGGCYLAVAGIAVMIGSIVALIL